MKNQKIVLTMFVMVFVFFVASPVLAGNPNEPVDTYEIPDPETPLMDPSGTIFLGKISSEHDDFVSYSAILLDKLGYDGFDIPVGTGGLDLLLATGANPLQNDEVQGGDGNNSTFFEFPPAIETPNANQANTLSGSWGNSVVTTTGNNGNGQSKTYGYASVDKILDFLHTYDPDINIPVFSFDMNEEKNSLNEDLYIAGLVSIWDMTDPNSPVFKTKWAFDNGTDIDEYDWNVSSTNPDPYGNYDGWVLSSGHIVIGDPSDPFYDIENNRGGGDLDFVAYAPEMDLRPYDDPKYMMLVDLRMKDLEAGFEEVFITGRYYTETTTVPEPATMLLFSAGLAGAFLKRKKRVI